MSIYKLGLKLGFNDVISDSGNTCGAFSLICTGAPAVLLSSLKSLGHCQTRKRAKVLPKCRWCPPGFYILGQKVALDLGSAVEQNDGLIFVVWKDLAPAFERTLQWLLFCCVGHS